MKNSEIIRKIHQTLYDFNDEDEFCECERLTENREKEMIDWVEKEYALRVVRTDRGYLFLK